MTSPRSKDTGQKPLPRARPVEDGLFVWPSDYRDARLIASRCPACGDVSFPRRNRCKNPSCMGSNPEELHLAGPGRLDTFTIQHYPPPPPFVPEKPFKPYAIGLVEFDEGIKLLGRIDTDDLSRVRVGAKAILTLGSIYEDETGDVVAWKFNLEDA